MEGERAPGQRQQPKELATPSRRWKRWRKRKWGEVEAEGESPLWESFSVEAAASVICLSEEAEAERAGRRAVQRTQPQPLRDARREEPAGEASLQ